MSAAPPAHRARRPDGHAAGQTIAMIVILLLCLPLLPLVLLVVAFIRLRDHISTGGRRISRTSPVAALSIDQGQTHTV